MKIRFDENKTKDKTVKIHCLSCRNVTKHKVLTSINERGSDEVNHNYSIYWDTDYEIVQCLGCETISFRSESSNSEEDDYDGSPYVTISIYPKRGEDTLIVKNYFNVPYNLQRLYRETIESYNYENLTLCGAGLRALVEGLCKENGVTGGDVEVNKNGNTSVKRDKNLEGKINGLSERGILTKQSADILHEHRFLGNDAIHDLSTPSKEDLNLAIEIVENIFENLYEIPNKGLRLKSKRLQK